MSDEVDPRALTCWDLLERLRTVMRDDDENLYTTTFLKLALSELMAKRAWETDASRAQVARWLQADFVPEVLRLYDDLQSRPQPAASAGGGTMSAAVDEDCAPPVHYFSWGKEFPGALDPPHDWPCHCGETTWQAACAEPPDAGEEGG